MRKFTILVTAFMALAAGVMSEEAPPEFLGQFKPRYALHTLHDKTLTSHTPADWRTTIDATWGPGLSTSEKLNIWHSFYTYIDYYFAAFHHLDPAIWTDVWNTYNTEVQGGVSRGRFCAILQHASRALQESHTGAFDMTVKYTEMAPGVPLLYCGGWGNNDHFGAALTPLPDSSLLVYKAIPSHPLGLVPGDIVLGYNRTPWKDLYQQLLQEELPVTGFWWGSSEPSCTHSWLMAAGMNWHLFDTLDVIKYSTKDTLHLATSPLAGQSMSMWGSEQVEIPGVSLPNYADSQLVSWGIIDGTTIGYIYCMGWFWNARTEWYNAIDSLMNQKQTTGLIVDFRTNYGGNMYLSYPGIQLLFNGTVQYAGFSKRCNTSNHMAMCLQEQPYVSQIPSDVGTFYDKPIAMLIGPGAVSSGDMVALALSHHPMAKVFGKPTSAAFNQPFTVNLASGFYFRYTGWDAFAAENSALNITHEVFPNNTAFPWIDYQPVWFTPDMVVQGKDDVVEAAKVWILSRDLDQDGLLNENDNCPSSYNPGQEDANHDGIGDACCCLASTGNVDCDPNDGVDISDLSALIDNLYIAFTPLCCPKEANVDGQPGTDISDLSALIDYLYISFTLPAVCQ